LATFVFWVSAVVAIAGGLGVVLSRQPIRSVLSLVAVMLALSVQYLLLSAQFLFAVQVIVYAGAVMVLFVFVIALLGPARELPSNRLRFQVPLSIFLIAILAGGAVGLFAHGLPLRAPEPADLRLFGSVQGIALGLFTTYLYPFELTSILLLVAAVGAIYLARRE
jgi:NADH-quinone oxidoreductase subunit J